MLRRYGSALAAVVLATLIRLWLHPVLGAQYPFPTFFIATTVVAWYAGLGPALFALALGGLSATYLIVPPANRSGDQEATYLLALSLYLIVGLTTTVFSESLRRARDAAKRAEQAERDQAQQLRAANEATHRFLAVLGHELRNPIATLSNALYVMEQTEVNPAAARQREIMQRQVRQLTRLTEDLLDVSRISQGRILLKPQRLDLVRVVREAADDCRDVYEEAGVAVCLDVAGGAIGVEGDPERLSQVVGNLLRNAAKFTDAGGRVTVGLERDGRWATLTVRDTGIGIAPEALLSLFNTFAQVEASRERSRSGLGLGLALVKGLVELHGGRVTAASDGLGHGAAFTVRLPLAPGECASVIHNSDS